MYELRLLRILHFLRGAITPRNLPRGLLACLIKEKWNYRTQHTEALDLGNLLRPMLAAGNSLHCPFTLHPSFFTHSQPFPQENKNPRPLPTFVIFSGSVIHCPHSSTSSLSTIGAPALLLGQCFCCIVNFKTNLFESEDIIFKRKFILYFRLFSLSLSLFLMREKWLLYLKDAAGAAVKQHDNDAAISLLLRSRLPSAFFFCIIYTRLPSNEWFIFRDFEFLVQSYDLLDPFQNAKKEVRERCWRRRRD